MIAAASDYSILNIHQLPYTQIVNPKPFLIPPCYITSVVNTHNCLMKILNTYQRNEDVSGMLRICKIQKWKKFKKYFINVLIPAHSITNSLGSESGCQVSFRCKGLVCKLGFQWLQQYANHVANLMKYGG